VKGILTYSRISSLFDDPDREERVLYIQYWQNKLKGRDSVSLPDALVQEVADATDKFSFAYLKEVLSVLFSFKLYFFTDSL